MTPRRIDIDIDASVPARTRNREKLSDWTCLSVDAAIEANCAPNISPFNGLKHRAGLNPTELLLLPSEFEQANRSRPLLFPKDDVDEIEVAVPVVAMGLGGVISVQGVRDEDEMI